MLIETIFSMLTLISYFEHIMYRKVDRVLARLTFTVAAFNLLIQWNGLKPDESGFIPLSIAQFSL